MDSLAATLAPTRSTTPPLQGRWRCGLGIAVGFAVALTCLLTALVNPSRPVVASSSSSVRAAGWSGVPVTARNAISAAVAAAEPGFRVRPAAVGNGFVATNPGQHLRATFAPTGIQIRSGAAELGLRVAGIGFPDAMEPLSASAPSADANRVTYTHRGITESYANGPLGLEQTFTIAHPTRTGGGPLSVAMTLSGNLHPTLIRDSVVFSRAGRQILVYRELTVTDAHGHELPARLARYGNQLQIQINARGAAYPIHVDPYVQSAELTASGAGNFGASVAVSSDGSTIVVGAPDTEIDDNINQGEVYVFSDASGSWKETKALTASSGSGCEGLGMSVAVSSDGSTVVAGAPASVNCTGYTGAAFVFTDTGGTWTTKELLPNDGGDYDGFGFSVAMSSDGSTIVVGAPTQGGGPGVVYVYTRPDGSWTQTGELTDSDDAGQDLGSAVAVSSDGSTVAAGAPSVSEVSTAASGPGAVYVFTHLTGDQTQTGELTDSSGTDDDLGKSVAISGDGSTVVAGAPEYSGSGGDGAVYVFSALTGAHTQTGELTDSDGGEYDELGASVAISENGSTVYAGEPDQEVKSDDFGAVDIFTDLTGEHTQSGQLTGSSGTNDLGQALALSSDGSTLVGGAPGQAVGSSSTQGVAYVFTSGKTSTPPPAGSAPKVVSDPVITGTAKANDTLSCSKGTWTGNPTTFRYAWAADGTPIAGATSGTYRVIAAEEGTTLTCTVTATNAKGSASATSKGMAIPVPKVKGCPAATGSVSATRVGVIRLGMTRTQARHALKRSTRRGTPYEDVFCLTPVGMRVGYSSPKLLKELTARQRRTLKDKVVFITTDNERYAAKGIRAGATLTAAKEKLPHGSLFTIGANDWYLDATGRTTYVLKLRHGLVLGIGITNPALTTTHKADRTLLTSFE